ncbi:MAG: hypothetical protein AMXMBFR4_03780 [Candidatus Hydrogenedentota bacterium]
MKGNAILLCVVTTVALFGPCGGALAQAQFRASKDVVAVTTALDQTGVQPGGAIRAAIILDIEKGWHVNSSQPLEKYLIATKVAFEPADGIAIDEIRYPKGEVMTFSFSKSPLSVYEGKTIIGAVIRVNEGAVPGAIPLKGSVQVQSCDDSTCLMPSQVPIEITIPILGAGETSEPQHPEIFEQVARNTEVVAIGPTGGGAGPEETTTPVDTPSTDRATTLERLDRFDIAGQAGGYLASNEFISWVDRVERGETSPQTTGPLELLRSVFSGGFSLKGLGLPVVIALTLIGGVALNLTPCVLPLIPINLAIIGAGAKAGSRSRGFLRGGLYGAGMAFVYGLLGVVTVLGAASFGAINSQWWFNASIAVVFVILALAMFDVILIDFSKYQSKLGIKKGTGNALFPFIMGCVNALLAGACVAPVVIAVILYSQDAYVNGSTAALALPFLLGVGMALPWPFAGGGMALLPKPGVWMVRVKQAFGVFILGFALYYGYQGYEQFSARYLVDRSAVLASVEHQSAEGWLTSLDDALAVAERENKPVLIDFWATWCKNCLVMNETTFKDPAVLARLENYVKVKYQAETPDAPPAKDVLARFDEYVGLPLYAVLEPKTN